MPEARTTQHRTIDDLAIGYVTNSSPTSTDPQWVAGADALTSIRGILEKRPGFAQSLEKVATSFVNLKRMWIWQRWDSEESGSTRAAFIAMFNDIFSGQSLVYKYQIGKDDSAILLHADQASENPFFFVDSNNQCYFGNETPGNMKRYDATTLNNWGIVSPAAAPNIHLPTGTVPSGGGGGTVGTSGQVTSVTVSTGGSYRSSVATVNFIAGGGSGATAVVDMEVTGFDGKNPLWSVSAINMTSGGSGYTSPPGVSISGDGSGGTASANISSGGGGSTTTGSVVAVATATAVDSYMVSQGSSLPALTFYQHVEYDTTPTAHGFTVGEFVSVSGDDNPLFNISGFVSAVPGANLFRLGFFQQAADTTGSGGNAAQSSSNFPSGIPVTVSKAYLTTYGYGTGIGDSAISVGESSPSLVSATVGPFDNNVPLIDLVPSPDSQVNQIHVYATTDGGALDPEEMREIDGSPFSNFVQTVFDTSTDDFLSGRNTAPAFLRNDPPPPARMGVWYAQRIWIAKSNTVSYSGFEEISNGVPEECFPSGLDGNNRPYNKDVTSLGVLPDGIAVFTPSIINKIEGDSLDTFRFYSLLYKRGARSFDNVSSVGGTVSWIDTSGTVWNSDMGEISIDIRPDTQNINQSLSAITTHVSGNYHWIVVMDGANGILLIFDLDKKQWLPPWNVGRTVTSISSFETSSGITDLLIARNGTKLLKLVPNAYNDDGVLYGGFVNTNQIRISPEQNPGWKGVIDWIEWKRNAVGISAIKQLTDDNPSTGNFLDLTFNEDGTSAIFASPEITQGKAILTERVTSNSPTAQLATVRFEWPATADKWELYSIDLASHQI